MATRRRHDVWLISRVRHAPPSPTASWRGSARARSWGSLRAAAWARSTALTTPALGRGDQGLAGLHARVGAAQSVPGSAAV